MSVFSRLFGKSKTEAPAPDAVPARDSAAAVVEQPEPPLAEAAEPAAEPAVSTPPAATVPEAPQIPLKSLGRYQQDPAYRNFMAKAKRSRDAGPRRPRLNFEELDRDRDKNR